MRKKALLALVLALTLLLSGCNLIVKDQAVDDNTAIITLGDTVVNKKEFNEHLDTMLVEEYNFYAMYGYEIDITDPDIVAEAKEMVVDEMEKTIIRDNKLKELGLDDLTGDADEIAARLQEEIEEYREEIKTYYVTDATLEGDALEAEVDRLMAEYGITEDALRATVENDLLNDKLREVIVKDVTVTDEEVAAEYNELTESDKATYDANPGSWAYIFNNGTDYYYTPEGVRMVKQILVKYTDEDQAILDSINDLIGDAYTDTYAAQSSLYYLGVTDYDSILSAVDVNVTPAEEVTGEYYMGAVNAEVVSDKLDENMDATQKDLSIQYAKGTEIQEFYRGELAKARKVALTHIDAEADDIIAQLNDGADWDALMAEKTQDPGMQAGASTAETGYAVAAGMTGFDTAFVDAALAIPEKGGISDKVHGEQYGYYIIKYVDDAKSGSAPLDQLADGIRESVLTNKQDTVYSETLEQWVSEAGFKVDLNALK